MQQQREALVITCTKLPDGDLLVTAGNETRQYIKDHLPRSYWGTLAELFEPYFTNGKYEPFNAGDANPFVGLTSAPCIAESMTTKDDGTRKVEGELWWFPSYCLRDPLDELKNTGRTVFTLARGND